MQKLIVIPARGGSKGIPGKNIYPVNGKPLLEYTLNVIGKANLSDTDVVVSTDSEDIMNVARNYSYVKIVARPDEISGDLAKTEDALLHALHFMEKTNEKKYDAVLTLQATSPLRKAETLQKFIQTFEEQYPLYDAMLSLNEDRADFWIIKEDGSFERRDKNAPRRRQDRVPLYVENSAYYITETQALKETKSVLGRKCNGFLISAEEAVDINEQIDIFVAEAMIKQREKECDKHRKC
ncbi:acylneuraminate cytidylyltransferase family protein [Pseudobutyrivibrio xylanivorans]|uniref:N-acylneuraminate cytidylyltransferase n=1 Tax=Pseudobutyrivibrio xylanivorans TaxID=185007 RepID=A0A1G5S4V9_PSEXY|nr:acylneuraminate cytidylyltransferase family protein [Pseudobutyrivibrio xylanivorans]SCZ81208.1 N-acylneuraminate cytidylyltransferase [Pseudobutyrivibrio xylanivorans]